MKLSLALVAGCLGSETRRRYDGDVVYRLNDVSFGDIANLKVFDKTFNFDFWQPESIDVVRPGMDVDIHVGRVESHELEYYLDDRQMKFDVLINNLEEAIANERDNTFDNTFDLRYNYEQYHTYDEVKDWAKAFGTDHSNAKYFTYGVTVEGREMFGLEIGNSAASKVISVDCGIHAREWVSPAYCQWFTSQLLEGDFKDYTKDLLFIIMPLVNPDGYAYSWSNDRMWRKNRAETIQPACKGIDLNRNYDANHAGPGAGTQPCGQTYCGVAPFSEKESAAQKDYMMPYMDKLKAFMTVHSYGQYMLYPYSYDYTSVAPNKPELQSLGLAMQTATRNVHNMIYTMGQGTDVLYAAAGGSDDWALDYMLAAGNKNPLSYTFECRDEGRYGFILPESQIKPNCEEIDAAFKEMMEYVLSM